MAINMDANDQEVKLQNELCWCIEQLSMSIESGKLSERKGNKRRIVGPTLHYHRPLFATFFLRLFCLLSFGAHYVALQHLFYFISAREVHKTMQVLQNPKSALIKKRQIMRTTFGDYRAKMAKEEKNFKFGNIPP